MKGRNDAIIVAGLIAAIVTLIFIILFVFVYR